MFEFQRLSQTDPRWKNTLLGFDPESTIGQYGCLLTCLAMAATGFGHAETPETLNEKMKALGPNVGFRSAFIVPPNLGRALPSITFKKSVDSDNSPAPIADIDAALAAGYPVIVEVDYSNAPGLQYHWIVLYGKKDGDYLLHDPWPYPPDNKEVLLARSRYAFAGPPERIITGAIFLEGPIRQPSSLASTPQAGPATSPAGAPSAAPAGALATGPAVYAIEADLALRTTPNKGANNLIKRLPLHAQLTSLEPADQTRRKIGAVDHWLKVRDASGAEGYAAAWYLSLSRQAPAPAASAQPSTASGTSPGALVVRTTTPDVALRSEPVVANHTLVKRLPFNARLAVLDLAGEAQPKIGVVNQWLKVRDSAGAEGYVAAWYVAATPA